MYKKLMLNDKKLMLNDETRRSMEYLFYFDKFCFNYTCKICIQKSDIMISISRNNRLISFIDKSFFIFQSRSISDRLTTISVPK